MIAAVRQSWDRLRESPLGRRLVHGLTWSLVGLVASRGANLLGSIVAARILGETRFGELCAVQNTSGMFALFAGFGMGVTATKYVAEFRRTDPAKAARVLGLCHIFAWASGAVMSVGLFAFAGRMATGPLAGLETVLRLGSLLPLFAAVTGMLTGALTGFESFRLLARLQAVTGIGTFVGIVAGAWWGGVLGVTAALVGSGMLAWWLAHLALRQVCREAGITVNVAEWRRELPVIWRFSLPALQASALVAPVNWYCSTVLLHDKVQVGYFGAANQWFTVLATIPNLVGQAMLPMLSEQIASAPPQEGVRLLKFAIRISSLTAIPMFLLAVASPLIMAVYGGTFAAQWPTMVLTVATAGILAVQAPVGQALFASGNVWAGFWMNVGWGIAFVVGSLFLVHWGAAGVAGARLLAYLVHTLWVGGFVFAVLRRPRGLRHG